VKSWWSAVELVITITMFLMLIILYYFILIISLINIWLCIPIDWRDSNWLIYCIFLMMKILIVNNRRDLLNFNISNIIILCIRLLYYIWFIFQFSCLFKMIILYFIANLFNIIIYIIIYIDILRLCCLYRLDLEKLWKSSFDNSLVTMNIF
jgi:hypothetical protein